MLDSIIGTLSGKPPWAINLVSVLAGAREPSPLQRKVLKFITELEDSQPAQKALVALIRDNLERFKWSEDKIVSKIGRLSSATGVGDENTLESLEDALSETVLPLAKRAYERSSEDTFNPAAIVVCPTCNTPHAVHAK
jgi:hypothetical protein